MLYSMKLVIYWPNVIMAVELGNQSGDFRFEAML